MSQIHDAITTAASAAGVKPETAIKQLEDKAFVGAVDGTEGVYVRAGGGAVATLATAVEELVPVAVRTQSAQDRATYAHVTAHRAARALPPEVSGKPKHEMGTSEYQAARTAAKREGRKFL